MSIRTVTTAWVVAGLAVVAAGPATAQTGYAAPYGYGQPSYGSPYAAQGYPPAAYVQNYYGSPYAPQAAVPFTQPQPVHVEPQGETLFVSGAGTRTLYNGATYSGQQGATASPLPAAVSPAAAPAAAPVQATPAEPATPTSAAASTGEAVAAGLPPQTFEQLYEARYSEPQQAAYEPDPHEGYGGWLSELRIGLLEHDAGVWSGKKEDGLDINGEVLFVSPDFLDIIFSPRPTIGGSIHTEGETNVLYFGLTWEWNITPWLYLEGQWGPAFHDGNLTGQDGDTKGYGCPVLSRGSAALGVRFDEHHSIQAFYSHMSNGDICEENDGIDAAGVRYGYRF